MSSEQRRKVTVNLHPFGEVESISISELESAIIEVQKRCNLEGIFQVYLGIDLVSGYYGDKTSDVNIIGTRWETDEELQLRQRQEVAAKIRQEETERQTYERLRKKFDKGKELKLS